MNILASGNVLGWLTPVILVAFFGIIVLIVILIKKKTNVFGGEEKPKSEAEVAEEELNRLLEDVKDESAKEAMESYVQAEEEKTEEEEEVQGEDKPIL